jgi:mannose-6-phosphate isomerase-like protein (cupin superfamily)
MRPDDRICDFTHTLTEGMYEMTEKKPAVILRSPADFETFRIKAGDGNYMAMIVDTLKDDVPFNVFFEVFESHGATPLHHHGYAHEIFFVLKGEGESVCEGETLPIKTGDAFLVRPGHDHIVRNTGVEKLYCLTIMVPDEGFAELVRSGIPMDLPAEDLDLLTVRPG